MLSKVIDKKQKNIKRDIHSLILVMYKPEFKKIYTPDIIRCLASFYAKKANRAILCNENPNIIYN